MSSRSTERPREPSRDAILADLAAAFRTHRVPAVLLRAPGTDAGSAGDTEDGPWRHDLDILVPRSARSAADAALATLDWRVAVGGLGVWRPIPSVTYDWDHGPRLEVHRGLPAGPLLPGSLRSLERALVSSSRSTPCGLSAPDAASLGVFSALQAARPGALRRMWLVDLAAHVQAAGVDPLFELARSMGLAGLIRWAIDLDPLETHPDPGGSIFDGRGRSAWWGFAALLQAKIRPRFLGALVGGTPRPDAGVTRSRFGGLDLRVGRGAFIPQSISEPMIDLALAGLPPGRSSSLVDVGTGVGAVALAVARARPDVEVHGCDLSKACIRWALRNAADLKITNVRFHRGSLLDPLDPLLADRVDVITANVPYVPARGPRARDRDGAIVGRGPDGLQLQRELLGRSMMFLAPQGKLIVQLATDQVELFEPSMAGWGMHDRGHLDTGFGNAIVWATVGPPAG